MITLEFCNSIRGDAPMYIEDSNPEQRKLFASKLMELLQEGQAIFLIQGEETRRIQGYDDVNNQWIVFADAQARPPEAHEPVMQTPQTSGKRGRPRKQDVVPAGGTRATAIGRSAGG